MKQLTTSQRQRFSRLLREAHAIVQTTAPPGLEQIRVQSFSKRIDTATDEEVIVSLRQLTSGDNITPSRCRDRS